MLTAGVPHGWAEVGPCLTLPRATGCEGVGAASSVQDPPHAAFPSALLQFSLAACVSMILHPTTCTVAARWSWALMPRQHACEGMQGASRALLTVAPEVSDELLVHLQKMCKSLPSASVIKHEH